MLATLIIAWLLTAILIYTWFYVMEIVLDLPVTGQTPCTAHASLKTIIRRVLRDASNMSILEQPQDESALPEATSNQTYEDLLATAILNKVIDNYQHDVHRSSSTGTNKKSDKPNKNKKSKHSNYNEETTTWKPQENFDTTSVSSVEDWCRSESSNGSKHVDPMSLTIQHSIEEISSTSEDDINQQYLHLSRNSMRSSDRDSNIDREDWQDNWLFSRKGKGSPKPVPVPMLVPSPSTEFRALIGDRDADDTTDLSETGSDIDEPDTVPDIKNILVESRTIIGGKNLLDHINVSRLEPETVSDEANEQEEEFDSENDESSSTKNLKPVIELYVLPAHINERVNNEHEETYEDDHVTTNNKQENGVNCQNFAPEHKVDDLSEAKNDIIIYKTPYEESDSLSSNTEKDAEYTEKYASFPRPISTKSPIPSPRYANTNNDEPVDNLEQSNEMLLNNEPDNLEEHELPASLRGSYSEREKEKWRNPIALSNNPYSKENLDKRLKHKSSINSENTFGRDYYIRDAKKSAGGKDKLLEDTSLEDSGRDFNQSKSLPSTNLNNNEYNNKYIVDPGVFTAVPAIVEYEEEPIKKQDNIITKDEDKTAVPNVRPHSLALSSDSDDIEIKRVYNLETGIVHKYKENDLQKEIIKNAKSPVGIQQFILDEMMSPADTNEKFDENHNEQISKQIQQEPVMKISAVNHLKTVDVQNFDKPPEEEDIESNANHETKENNLSTTYNGEIRDISKKYLNSLVRNNSRPAINVVLYTTPPISIQEHELDEPMEFKTNGLESPVKYKSCIDLRSDSDEEYQNEFLNSEYPSLKQKKLVSRFIEDYAKSVPNLVACDDGQPAIYPDESVVKSSLKTIIDPEEITKRPSVKDLMKLFDIDKPQQKEIKSTTSHLTIPKFNSQQKQVHSLTARSIPMEFRRELQKSSDENITSDRNEIDPAEDGENVLKQIPKCRLKIEFFECLGNK